eukprot:TRINITY_DN24678_c0_g1_i1.p1 TRINITY_DN24678_c0_g1~~TRINITY_DN24678_c0_g1_i1.p1  ORF type:complete len:287 (+),score=43.51 TRINITY_DN24678_c0_g1_i1:59-919(+)
MKTISGAVLVVDGGYWLQGMVQRVDPSEWVVWWKKHAAAIEQKTGPIVHTTVVDGDPSDFVIESIMEGVTQEDQIRNRSERQEERVDFYNNLTSELGVNAVDLKLRGYKFQRVRKIQPPPKSDPRGRCQWFYHQGLAQRGVDVCYCVRVMEYCCSLFKTPSGATVVPTAIVCLTADSDMEPVFETLNRITDLPTYLAAYPINPSNSEKRICRELEAYIPTENRIFLESLPSPFNKTKTTSTKPTPDSDSGDETKPEPITGLKIRKRLVRRKVPVGKGVKKQKVDDE